jgi:hypothetical protein
MHTLNVSLCLTGTPLPPLHGLLSMVSWHLRGRCMAVLGGLQQPPQGTLGLAAQDWPGSFKELGPGPPDQLDANLCE